MIKTLKILSLTLGMLTLGTAAILTIDVTGVKNAASAVMSFGQSNSSFDTCIEELNIMKSDVVIEKLRINDDSIKDALIMHTSDSMCGSSGCVHEICASDNGGFKLLNFSIAAHEIKFSEGISNGMHDLELNGDKKLVMKWNGQKYELNNIEAY